MSVSGRVVAITGGTRGIGRSVAEHFLRQGDAVAVGARRAESDPPLDGVLELSLDVRHKEQQERFVRNVLEHFGHLDVFINCAGVSRWRPLEEIDQDFVSEIVETNLLGTLWGCAAAAPALNAGGSIVNVSSLAGKRGSARNAVYCASKFGVNGITQALAKELGPRNIRINAVCPVYVLTAHILSSLQETASPARGHDVSAYLASFAANETALGRLPSVDEIAATIGFLASPAASAITGQCINVDCGTLPQ